MLSELYHKLAEWGAKDEKVLIHQEELGDHLQGVVAGYLVWSGMVPSSAHAISIVEQINQRQMGPPGRELVALARTLEKP
jgi:hypothetical protein